MMETLRLDYVDNNFANTPSKKFVEVFYKTNNANKMTIPIDTYDPWPCTSKGFLANTNGEIVPENVSRYFTPTEVKIYLLDGINGERSFNVLGRFEPIDGEYWTTDKVNLLKGRE